jgi:hypothetical protein
MSGRSLLTRILALSPTSLVVVSSVPVHTVANAWASGVSHVDIYLFPAYECEQSASDQVNAALANMGSIPFGTLWLDIESEGSNWSGNAEDNQEWLTEAINAASVTIGSNRVGIYSSASGWSSSMGDFTGASDYPLWVR